MKKLLSLACAVAATFGASAQAPANRSLVLNGKHHLVEDVHISNSAADLKAAVAAGQAAKTTAANNRYYNQSDILNQTVNPSLQSTANTSIIPIWHDSTIRQRFSTGLGAINYSSINQYFDPINSDLINDASFFGTEMLIKSTNAYRVDSVIFFGAYIRRSNKAAIVDTMVLSVAADNGRYALRTTSFPQYPLADYLPAGKDTLFAYTVLNVDSINRAAFSGIAGGQRAFWKVPLTASMGDTADPSGSVTLDRFAFAVPGGGFNIPAGNGFNVTATFKSGDTWVRNVDTIGAFNSFRPVTYGTSSIMPYYFYDFGRDRNMSGMMFSTDSANYTPSVIIEAVNSNSFDYEFHDVTAYVTCSTCTTIDAAAIKEVSNARIGTAYPNPANQNVIVPVTLAKSSDLSVTLSNAVGQVVASQDLGRVAAGQLQRVEISTARLTPGVYFYTVNSAGTKQTGRVLVAR